MTYDGASLYREYARAAQQDSLSMTTQFDSDSDGGLTRLKLFLATHLRAFTSDFRVDPMLLAAGADMVYHLCSFQRLEKEVYQVFLDTVREAIIICAGAEKEIRFERTMKSLLGVFRYLDRWFTSSGTTVVQAVLRSPALPNQGTKKPQQSLMEAAENLLKDPEWKPDFDNWLDRGTITELTKSVDPATQARLDKLAAYLDKQAENWAQGGSPELKDVAAGHAMVLDICGQGGATLADAEHQTYALFLDYVRGITAKFEGEQRVEAVQFLVSVFGFLDQQYTAACEQKNMVKTKVPTSKLCPGQTLKDCAEAIAQDPKWIPDFQSLPPVQDTTAAFSQAVDGDIDLASEYAFQGHMDQIQNADYDLECTGAFDWELYNKLLRDRAGMIHNGDNDFKGAQDPVLTQKFQQSQMNSPPAPVKEDPPPPPPKEKDLPWPEAAPVDPDHHFPYPFHKPDHAETILAAAAHPVGTGPPRLVTMIRNAEENPGMSRAGMQYPGARFGGLAAGKARATTPGIYVPDFAHPGFGAQLAMEEAAEFSAMFPPVLQQSHFGIPVDYQHFPYYPHQAPTAAREAGFAPRRIGTNRLDDYTAALRPLPGASLGVPRVR